MFPPTLDSHNIAELSPLGVAKRCGVSPHLVGFSMMYGSTDVWIYRCMNLRIYGSTNLQICGSTHTFACTDFRIYGSTDVWIYGSTDLRMYGSTDVRMYGCTDVRIYRSTHMLVNTDLRIYGSTDDRRRRISTRCACQVEMFQSGTSDFNGISNMLAIRVHECAKPMLRIRISMR